MSAVVDGDSLGEQFAGYKFRISGGNDKQGFCMTQGVLTSSRVRLLLKNGSTGYRQRRTGEMKRKSVRGCIVAPDLAVLNLVVVNRGSADIEGITDQEPKPIRLGPKRASKIRKMFGLEKTDDVRKFVVRRSVEGKNNQKAPKIQRLVTPQRLARKNHQISLKRNRAEKNKKEAAAYAALVAQRKKEQKEMRQALIAKRRASSRASMNA